MILLLDSLYTHNIHYIPHLFNINSFIILYASMSLEQGSRMWVQLAGQYSIN